MSRAARKPRPKAAASKRPPQSRQFTTRPGMTEDEEADYERERERDLRWANKSKPGRYYIEISRGRDGWFWVVGEEDFAEWIADGDREISAAVAETKARMALSKFLRQYGLPPGKVTTQIDRSTRALANRLKNAM